MPISKKLSLFQSDSIYYKSLPPPWVHGRKVRWTVLWTWLVKRATMLSKVTGFYPKICSSISLTKLNMFLRTNFFCTPFSESSDQGLSKCQPQNKSWFKIVGFYCRFKWQPLVRGKTWRKKLLEMVKLSCAHFKG